MAGIPAFLKHGGRVAWGLLLSVPLVFVASTFLLWKTADARYVRDVTRMGFNDNLELLEEVKREVGAVDDSLETVLSSSPESPGNRAYLVVSIEDHRLWYKQGDSVLFTTQVATGSGKVLEKEGGSKWKFETPRGRLVVQNKETDPAWVPPDWHYVELAKKKGLGLVRLQRGQSLPATDGSVITVAGSDVIRQYPDGRVAPFEVKEGREIVVGGNMIIPPFGTNQRKYTGVLGTHRLNLGDGYALHGTDKPETIGRSVSHGCIRLRNEDIERLYNLVPTGTPVFIY